MGILLAAQSTLPPPPPTPLNVSFLLGLWDPPTQKHVLLATTLKEANGSAQAHDEARVATALSEAQRARWQGLDGMELLSTPPGPEATLRISYDDFMRVLTRGQLRS